VQIANCTIRLQPVERDVRHSELEPQESVVDGVEGRRQVEADHDSSREYSIQDLQ